MYLVLEIQTSTPDPVTKVSTVTTQINNFQNEADAQSNYHTVLASAATSQLPYHAAMLIRNDGLVIEKRCFEHYQEPQQTTDSGGTVTPVETGGSENSENSE